MHTDPFHNLVGGFCKVVLDIIEILSRSLGFIKSFLEYISWSMILALQR